MLLDVHFVVLFLKQKTPSKIALKLFTIYFRIGNKYLVTVMIILYCIYRTLEGYCSIQDPLLAGYLQKQRVRQHLYRACLVRLSCQFIFIFIFVITGF